MIDVSEFAWLGILIGCRLLPGRLDEANNKYQQQNNEWNNNQACDKEKIPSQPFHQPRHQLQNKFHSQSVAEESLAKRRVVRRLCLMDSRWAASQGTVEALNAPAEIVQRDRESENNSAGSANGVNGQGTPAPLMCLRCRKILKIVARLPLHHGGFANSLEDMNSRKDGRSRSRAADEISQL